MNDVRLSPNFTLREFLRSATASRMGRAIEDPPIQVIDELERLCLEVLEPARAALGNRPITILSGWRPQWLNTAVGGSPRSDHMLGRAADLVVAGLANEAACQLLLAAAVIPIRQCILEFPPNGWVHVSVGRAGAPARREFITAVKNGRTTVYLTGIRGGSTGNNSSA